ncbi:MAG: HAD hydrolase-like protein [Ignavibacteriae bacterium]|nr:HAD hydrolase-like protein [Ignavibacteriota bacterium]
MNLVIFDIDGTLTDTTFVDHECYEQTLFDRFGIRQFPSDVNHFQHYTDPAILSQIYEERFGSTLAQEELERVRLHYTALLRATAKIWPQLFLEIPGASSLLGYLRHETDWKIAIGTGSWSESARLKLDSAKIEFRDLPLATADDGMTREEIMKAAVRRALRAYRADSFSHITIVGDGVWDLRTARNMNYGFVGIASGSRAGILRKYGATHILPDLRDFKWLVESLEATQVLLPTIPAEQEELYVAKELQ